MNASTMMMQAAIASERDGHGFGVAVGTDRGCYRLTLTTYEDRSRRDDTTRVGSARLQLVDDAGDADDIASIVCGWQQLLECAAADFGTRLEAKGRDRGGMPQAGGRVHLHPQFGRELVVLSLAASSHQDVEEACRLWREATPEWRLQLYHRATHDTARRTMVYPEDRCREEVLEDLRLRAPDGSKDLAREARVLGPRREAAAQRKAIQHSQRERAVQARKVLGRGAHAAAP